MWRRGPARISTWEEAEFACADWMRRNGWPTATVTSRGADRGIDINGGSDTHGRDAVAQVKYHTRPVGRPVVQQLASAALESGARGLLFSRNGYSREAIESARIHGIALYQFNDAGEVEEVLGVEVITIDASSDAEEDPRVTRLDDRIHELTSLAARVHDTISRRSRQKLSFRERSALKRAREEIFAVASDMEALEQRYEAGKWRASARKLEKIERAYKHAAARLGLD